MPPNQTGAAKTAAGGSSVRGRTKHEQDQLQRKTVYRPVLDNPLSVAWPPLPASVRRSILGQLLPVLSARQDADGQTVAQWRADEHAARRHKSVGKGKGKRDGTVDGTAPIAKAGGPHAGKRAAASDLPAAKKVKLDDTHDATTARSGPKRSRATAVESVPARLATRRPRVLDYVSVGINEVTKALETRIRWGRWELGDSRAIPGASQLLTLAQRDALLPTAAAEDASSTSSRRHRPRLRKKANPTAVSPHVASKLDSIDYSTLPGYEFLADRTPRPSLDRVPPYCVVPSNDGADACPRLLVNSETLRIKRVVKLEQERACARRKAKRIATREEVRRLGKERGSAVDQARTVDEVGNETEHAEGSDHTVGEDRSTGHEMRQQEESDPTTATAEQEEEEDAPTVPLIDVVFVCKPDINPPSLVAHLPGMVAASNGVHSAVASVLDSKSSDLPQSVGDDEKMEIDPETAEAAGDVSSEQKQKRPEFGQVRLVPLDQGAERILADALGLRRVACIGISSMAPGAQELMNLVVRHVEAPLAPWLTPHLLHPPRPRVPATTTASTYVETHIKHLKTTAPLNPRAAHLEKKAQRKSAKDERRKRKRGDGDVVGAVYEANDDDDDGEREG